MTSWAVHGNSFLAVIHSFNDGTLDGATQKADGIIRWKNSFGNTPTNGTGPSLSRDYLPMTMFTYANLNRAFRGFYKKINLIVPGELCFIRLLYEIWPEKLISKVNSIYY